MKNIFKGFAVAALLVSFTACSDDSTVPSQMIDASTVTTVSKPGEVVFHWAKVTDPDYYYIKVKYNDPAKGEVMKTASAYADSLVIDGLFAKYGKIDFHISGVSRDGGETTPFTVTAQAGAVPATVKDMGTDFTLSGDDLWTDDQEESEGPIKDLVDGNTSTYFHMKWNGPTPFPHYIVVDLKKEIKNVRFSYVCRNNANKDNPKQITVFGSTEFNKSVDDLSKATELTVLSGLPTTQAASYTSPDITSATAFRYLWLRIDASTSGSQWIALAELTVREVNTVVYDPENE